ncbi:MAG: ABC transporter permease [Thermoleophilia bacterium]
MRAFWDFFRADWQMMVRNRQALFWTFFFPVLLMLLLGVVFGRGYGGDFKLAVVNQDNGPVASSLLAAFGHVSGVKLSLPADAAAAMKSLKNGNVNGVLVIPAGTSTGFSQAPQELPFTYDNSNITTAGQVQSITSQVVVAVGNQLSGVHPKLTIAATGTKTKSFNYLDFLVPGIVALSLMQTGIFGVAGVLVTYKEKGILRRLKATPLSLSSFVAGSISVRMITAIIQTALILAIGMAFFHVHVNGSLLRVLVVTLLGAGAFVSLGFAIASVSKNQEAAQAVMQVVQMPMMFLSGIFFPMDNAPAWIQPIVKAMPLKYLADAMRAIVVNSSTLWSIRVDIMVLVGVTAVFMLFSIKFFRWE